MMLNSPVQPEVKRAAFALVYTAVALTFLEYVFLPLRVQHWLSGKLSFFPQQISLKAGIIWALGCITAYLVLPFLFVKFWHREKPASIGYDFSGFKKHLKVYVWLYVGLLPLIFIAAQMPSFQKVYPFVSEVKSSLPKFLIWELFYVLQFFALESFFRGYLLFTLEKVMHAYVAIAVMVIPYAMIHFHKPMLETLGAILAGIGLGYLSLKYRSWAGGALLHALVAITMDSIACARAGLF